jgi:hypothetical protein
MFHSKKRAPIEDNHQAVTIADKVLQRTKPPFRCHEIIAFTLDGLP